MNLPEKLAQPVNSRLIKATSGSAALDERLSSNQTLTACDANFSGQPKFLPCRIYKCPTYEFGPNWRLLWSSAVQKGSRSLH